MKRRDWAVLLVALGLTISGASVEAATDASPRLTLHDDTGSPLADVRLEVLAPGGVLAVTTDAAGQMAVPVAGPFFLSFTGLREVPAELSDRAPSEWTREEMDTHGLYWVVPAADEAAAAREVTVAAVWNRP